MSTAPATEGLAADDPLALGWESLRREGWLDAEAFSQRADELIAVRKVAARDVALGRVFDGHRNALERLLAHRPQDVPEAERVAAATGALALGVWGADPGPDDGPPAVLASQDGRAVVRGVKTFCSGAGLLDRAIVLVRRAPDAPSTLPVLVDLRAPGTLRIDRDWFVGGALRESRSDLVHFDDAPVLAILGSDGTLTEEPWISGDALRSSAVWAGAVDTIVTRLVAWAQLQSQSRELGEADLERLGRADAIRATIDLWLFRGFQLVERGHEHGSDPAPAIATMRLEMTERARELVRLAAELTGSRGLVADRALTEARDGLDRLLLQHRLGRLAVRRGRALSAYEPAPHLTPALEESVLAAGEPAPEPQP